MAEQWIANDFGGLDVLELREVDVPDPQSGEVTIDVLAIGVNPTDYKGISGSYGVDRSRLPLMLGYEVAGIISAIGSDTEIASGGGAVGDEVIAFRISGGYATSLTVPAKDVFAKPESLDFPEAANLMLVGATALDMIRVVPWQEGETVLIHGASGSVGVVLLQLAQLQGVRAIGTSSESAFGKVRGFGGDPIAYGDGLEARIRQLAPGDVDASYDCVGTDEAVDASLALTKSKDRIVTIANQGRAKSDGFAAVGGGNPESSAYRDTVRADLIDLAGQGKLTIPVAKTFPFAEAVAALDLVKSGHPGGKVALLP
ncbi:NADP-dependent oxidoreductase [Naasia lichenicola]|uniref:NADP-dependent oxidoreductase n=1 Tax=Naasia lichenicola TaxID=2565933 RepID=A0A4V3WTU6_9MICO|nr:NADP-dependent oxidoreductase [Naasia lichenicola]THG33337.1 NADP-dependent oxidoreductase [Naasia lichenicola]